MKKNNKTKYLFRLLLVFFICFSALLIAYESGYYETKARNKATLTKEAMIKFEEDLANNEIIDINDYLKEEKVDYSNKVTKIGNKLTSGMSEIMTNGISGVFNTLKGLFW